MKNLSNGTGFFNIFVLKTEMFKVWSNLTRIERKKCSCCVSSFHFASCLLKRTTWLHLTWGHWLKYQGNITIVLTVPDIPSRHLDFAVSRKELSNFFNSLPQLEIFWSFENRLQKLPKHNAKFCKKTWMIIRKTCQIFAKVLKF